MQAYETAFKAGDTRFLINPRSDFFRFFSSPTSAKARAPQEAEKKP